MWPLVPVIVLGYGIKKIIDAATSSSSSSSSSSSPSLGSRIDEERTRRTEVRREALKSIISKRHVLALDDARAIAEREAREIGQITVEKTFYGVDIDCRGVNKALSAIKMQMPKSSRGYSRTMDSQSLHLDSINVSIEEILQAADTRFGPLAGFDNNDVYHKKDDPFMKRIRDLDIKSSVGF
jgi:hypothetical protein